jgi:hypothetical protein
MIDPEAQQQRDLDKLAEEAERLQTAVNEFIGRATIANIAIPGVLYDANATLIELPGQLRQIARRSADYQAFRHGVQQAQQDAARQAAAHGG